MSAGLFQEFSEMSKLAYRPDIDGLRAVAVLLVIFFHAGLGFPGGFVGVDVFFVISGYLITSVIRKEQDCGEFSLIHFWTRRIRRLVPASLVMVLVTFAVGTLILFPRDLDELAKSAISQQLLISNIYFSRHTGYFDGPSDLKPLLHTWSLSVEEQFYLIFPILLVLIHRWTKPVVGAILAVCAVSSFLLSLYALEISPSSAYFLLPFRAWEMLLGSVLCFLPDAVRTSAWRSDLMAGCGLSAIGVSSVCYSSQTPFPGSAALLPCLGAASVLCAGGVGNGYLVRALGSRSLVGLGLISYSLYLWHWPLLAYLKYELGQPLPIPLSVAAVLASLGMGYLSWRFVEQPFRNGVLLTGRLRPVIGLTIGGVATIAIGFLVVRLDGLPERYSGQTRRLLATMDVRAPLRTLTPDQMLAADNLPVLGDPEGSVTCLLWGDSHAMALAPALDTTCAELGIRCIQATRSSTLPVVEFQSSRDQSHLMVEFNQIVFKHATSRPYDIVILGGYWSRESDNPNFVQSLRKTIAGLHAVGSQVLVVRDVPDQKEHVQTIVGTALRHGTPLEELGVTLAAHRQQQASADKALFNSAVPGVRVIDPTPYLLDQKNRCRVVVNGESIYWDNDHLSLAGCARLIPMFREELGGIRQTAGRESSPRN